jgi:hypothetical protein
MLIQLNVVRNAENEKIQLKKRCLVYFQWKHFVALVEVADIINIYEYTFQKKKFVQHSNII